VRHNRHGRIVLQKQPWDELHRVDVIDPDTSPDVTMAEEGSLSTQPFKNSNGEQEQPNQSLHKNGKPRLQRYYETFLWKHNDMTLKDYKINYRVEGPVDGPLILLVHGFGANLNHFRFQFPALVAEGYRVFAIDLLGFGGSDKPHDEQYSIELFVQLLNDFVLAMHPDKKWIAAGNSIGGLCSLGLADKLPDTIQGVVLFNSSGGMSSFRYEQFPVFVRPILWFVQKVILGNPKRGGDFFEKFKTRKNVKSILMTQGVYGNKTNVDEELLEILLGPADDEGARDVFLKVFGGDPGPTPESFLAKIRVPVLALWGEADPWTVVAMGEAFSKYAAKPELYRLERLPGAGHCPHDEAPELVHEIMLPWLKEVLNDKHGNGEDDGTKMASFSTLPKPFFAEENQRPSQ